VCLESFPSNKLTTIELECRHKYHDLCFIEYINSLFDRDLDFVVIKCPLCRKAVSYKSIAIWLHLYLKMKGQRKSQIKAKLRENKIKLFKVQAKQRMKEINILCFKHCFKTKCSEESSLKEFALEYEEEISKFNLLCDMCNKEILKAKNALKHVDPDKKLRLVG